MKTKVVPLSEEVKNSPALKKRLEIRTMSADRWVEEHASGTLRKNKRLGMAWKSHYYVERSAYEFGWKFGIVPQSRILVGNTFTEGDNSAITEAGWHIERYQEMNIFPEDIFLCKYINVEFSGKKGGDDDEECDGVIEGIGIVVKQTSAPWVPEGHTVFAIVSEFSPKSGKWKKAQNPF